jgi:hypothetical protein
VLDRYLLERAGQGDLHPLPPHVSERYRLARNSARGNQCVIVVERFDNEDILELGYLPADGVPTPLGWGLTYRMEGGSTLTVDRHRHRLSVVQLSPDGGVKSGDRDLDEIRWATLTALLRLARFWELPEDNTKCGGGGATWTLEGSAAGRYHRVSRWSPEPEYDEEWFVLPAGIWSICRTGLPSVRRASSPQFRDRLPRLATLTKEAAPRRGAPRPPPE